MSRASASLRLAWASLLVAGCGAREAPPAAPVEARACEVHQIDRVGDALFLSACGHLVRVTSGWAERLDFCGAGHGVHEFLALDADHVIVRSSRCDLRRRAVEPIAPGREHRIVTRPSRARTEVLAGGDELLLVGPAGARTERFDATIDRVKVTIDDEALAVWLEDGSAHLVDLLGRRPDVRLAEDLPSLVHSVHWRGEHVAFFSGGRVTVFRAEPPARAVLEHAGTATRLTGALSPDGRWLAVADALFVRVLSTEDGAERWWQQASQRSEPDSLRWTPDGESIVLQYPRAALRVHGATGDILAWLEIPRMAFGVVAPDASALAMCVATRRGRSDRLVLSDLRREAGEPAGGVHRHEPRPVRRILRPLPDGSCSEAELEWLDDTLVLRGAEVRSFRGARSTALRVSAVGDELLLERDGRIARLGHDARRALPGTGQQR